MLLLNEGLRYTTQWTNGIDNGKSPCKPLLNDAAKMKIPAMERLSNVFFSCDFRINKEEESIKIPIVFSSILLAKDQKTMGVMHQNKHGNHDKYLVSSFLSNDNLQCIEINHPDKQSVVKE